MSSSLARWVASSAQRRAADVPGLGQRQFVDVFARGQLALEHHGAQAGGHAVVQGRAAQGDRLSHGWRL